MDEKKYSQLYQALLQEVLQFHNGNQRRIRKGMLSLLLVPLVFLVLLFLSEGSRVIFLLLWIVSMFGIAAYLIAVEYIDYEMQNKVKKITKKEVELDQLTPLPSAMPQLLPCAGRGRSRTCPRPAQEEQESFAQSAARRRRIWTSCSRGCEASRPPPRRSRSPAPAGLRSRRTAAPSPACSTTRPGTGITGSPEAETLAGGAGIRDGIRGGARPRFRACFCPGESRPCPAGIPGQAPQPVSPDLNQALAGLQTDVQQLAQGLDQLSRELGRISRYMEDQKNRTKEERK